MANRPNRSIAAILLAITLLAAGNAPAAEEQKKININTAPVQELTSLRGIGPATAQAIVSYRESHGPFKSVEELVEVKGIGEKMMASLRDQVTIGTSGDAGAPKPKSGS